MHLRKLAITALNLGRKPRHFTMQQIQDRFELELACDSQRWEYLEDLKICDDCDRYVLDTEPVRAREGYRSWCEDCRSESSEHCPECGEVYSGLFVCPDCKK